MYQLIHLFLLLSIPTYFFQTKAQLLSTLPPSLQDEIDLKVPEIIKKYDYSVETHHITTEDGYILELHRILPKSKKPSNVPILLMHGLLSSSADWIITGPQNGLGYILSDQGYDIWLGNARGNRYSRNHTNFNPDSNKFWNFSWHEIGIYDLPAMVDYIIEKTGQEQIAYIGHSQGTTTFYVMCTEKPEYNKKIQVHFSLAPIGYVSHMKSPLLQILAKEEIVLKNVAKLIGLNEFLPQNGLLSKINQKICSFNDITELVCSNTLFALCGFDYRELNMTILPLVMAHVPAGSSSKQFIHYAQEINSGKFRKYDYGWIGNRKHYGTFIPSDYKLEKITVPIYLMFSNNDWLSSRKDVQKLYKNLRSVKGKFLIANGRFNHLDYLFGIDAPRLLYSKIVSLLTRYKST